MEEGSAVECRFSLFRNPGKKEAIVTGVLALILGCIFVGVFFGIYFPLLRLDWKVQSGCVWPPAV